MSITGALIQMIEEFGSSKVGRPLPSGNGRPKVGGNGELTQLRWRVLRTGTSQVGRVRKSPRSPADVDERDDYDEWWAVRQQHEHWAHPSSASAPRKTQLPSAVWASTWITAGWLKSVDVLKEPVF
jgi:hypothetical protein